MADSPRDQLHRYWGYSTFRQPQEEIIQSALASRDNLVVMATGAGKSLCYQVPALVSGKPTVVISPLISLMEDQVAALEARDIPAFFFGSGQTNKSEYGEALSGKYAMLYMTPEFAVKAIDDLKQVAAGPGLGLIAIDEAHCVSEWGHDFRPVYRDLHVLRQALPSVPLMALTATATPAVQKDIQSNLRMRPSMTDRWVASFERPNLHFSVRSKHSDVLANFWELTNAHAKGETLPTIIYTISKKEAEQLVTVVNRTGLKAEAYHAGLSLSVRNAVHRNFMLDKIDVVIATIAFGMGIDKPNVRMVYHFGAPGSVEGYYQQAGRAGRDGLKSRCILTWAPKDFQMHSFMNMKMGNDTGKKLAGDGLAKMRTYCNSNQCRQRFFVEYFGSKWGSAGGPCPGGCDKCEAAGPMGAVSSQPHASAADLSASALLLLESVLAFNEFAGLTKPILLLCGSNSKNIFDNYKAARTRDGVLLHGAGVAQDRAWWNALGEQLVAGEMLMYKQRRNQQRSWMAAVLTAKGRAFMKSPYPLMWTLDVPTRNRSSMPGSADMRTTEAPQAGIKAEEARLRVALLEKRGLIASVTNQPPVNVCGDRLLAELCTRRPGTLEALATCEGAHQKFCSMFGNAFLEVIREFCKHSSALNLGGWVAKRASGGVASWADRRRIGSDDAMLDNFIKARPAALETLDRFMAGESVEQIATSRLKPIKQGTVLGYLCDALSAREVDNDVWIKLRHEVGLTDAAKATQVYNALQAHSAEGMGAVKAALPPEYDYSVIKAVAAAMRSKRLQLLGIQPVDLPASPASGGGDGVNLPAAIDTATETSPHRRPADDDAAGFVVADDSDDDGHTPRAAVAAHLKRSSPDVGTTPDSIDDEGDDELSLTAPVKVRKAAPGLGRRVMPSSFLSTSGGWKTKK